MLRTTRSPRLPRPTAATIPAVLSLLLLAPSLAACDGPLQQPTPATISPATPDVSPGSERTSAPPAGTTTTPMPSWPDAGSPAPPAGTTADVASWDFPTSAPGWTAAVRDQDGVNQLTRADGCQLTSQQNPVDTAASGGDRQESESRIEASRQAYEQAGVTDLSYSSSEDVASIHGLGGSSIVETIRMDLSYTGADGNQYTGVRWFRAFTRMRTPMLLQLSYFCPAPAYDATALDALLKDVSIIGASPTGMDG